MNDHAVLIRPDGSLCKIWPKGKEFSVEELQALVGGYIELVRVAVNGEAVCMFCNEDGIRLELEPNFKASAIARQHVVGAVVIVPNNLVS